LTRPSLPATINNEQAMERLTPDDASFLQMEDETHAMHHVTVAVFEGPEPAYRDLYERIASRVSLVPRLRQRVLEVPFGIARPVWIDDAQFTLEDHLRRTGLPSADDPGGLPDLVGRLLSHQLDRGRPLWTMWLVSGLPDDRFAVISQAHMAMVDGVSGTDPLALATDQMVHIRIDFFALFLAPRARLALRIEGDALGTPAVGVTTVHAAVRRLGRVHRPMGDERPAGLEHRVDPAAARCGEQRGDCRASRPEQP